MKALKQFDPIKKNGETLENVSCWSIRRLIDGTIQGDPEAAARFYEKFGARIRGRVWRYLGADPHYDDMVNQVYVGILSSLKRLKDVDSIEAWIDKVVFQTISNELSKRKYRRIVMAQSPLVEDTRDTANPGKLFYARVVYDILNQMDARNRMIFTLRYLDGRTLDEVASISGFSVATVKRRLIKAKREFESKLKQDSILISILGEYGHVY